MYHLWQTQTGRIRLTVEFGHQLQFYDIYDLYKWLWWVDVWKDFLCLGPGSQTYQVLAHHGRWDRLCGPESAMESYRLRLKGAQLRLVVDETLGHACARGRLGPKCWDFWYVFWAVEDGDSKLFESCWSSNGSDWTQDNVKCCGPLWTAAGSSFVRVNSNRFAIFCWRFGVPWSNPTPIPPELPGEVVFRGIAWQKAHFEAENVTGNNETVSSQLVFPGEDECLTAILDQKREAAVPDWISILVPFATKTCQETVTTNCYPCGFGESEIRGNTESPTLQE